MQLHLFPSLFISKEKTVQQHFDILLYYASILHKKGPAYCIGPTGDICDQ